MNIISPFNQLPDETILHIYSYLDRRVMRSCAQVSRQFYAISRDPKILEALDWYGWQLTNKLRQVKAIHIHYGYLLSFYKNYPILFPKARSVNLMGRCQTLSCILPFLREKCSNLQELHLEKRPPRGVFNFLPTTLTTITLWDCKIESSDYKKLCEISSLTSITFKFMLDSDSIVSCDHIGAMTNLKKLKLYTSSDRLTASDLEKLSTLTNLTKFCIKEAIGRIDRDKTHMFLKNLNYYPSLTSLEFGGCDLCYTNLDSIFTLTHLKILKLSRVSLSKDNINRIATSFTLSHFKMSGITYGDSVIKHLTPLKDSLKFLNLRRTSLTDKAIVHLIKFTNLCKVSISSNNITEKSYQFLSEKLKYTIIS